MKYLNLLCLSLLIILFCSCKEETNITEKQKKNEEPTQLVDDETIHQFLNSILANKDCKYIFDKEALPYFTTESDSLLVKIDSLFSNADLNFIYRQALYSRAFTIKQKYFNDKEIISLDLEKVFEEDFNIRRDYWDKILNKYKTVCFARMPLFSIDKLIAIVSISTYCGSLCGEGGTYIYRKKSGKWILVKTLEHHIS